MSQGIQLRLTHTGQSASFILLDDLKQQGIPRGKALDPVYIPAPTAVAPNPSIDITYGGLVPFSFETGDIRGYISQGDLTAQFLLGDPVEGVVVVTDPTYTIRPGDTTLLVSRVTPGAVLLTLPPGVEHTGRVCVVDAKGDSATNNIIILAAVGETIGGGASVTLSTNNGVIDARWRTASTDWYLPVDQTAGNPTGSAGGDLGGSYPNPTVATVGGSPAATVASQRTSHEAAVVHGFSWQGQWAAAPVDTVRNRVIFPLTGIVTAIRVAAIGTAPLAGTIAFQAGIGAGGNTLLNVATFDLTTLAANANPGDNNSTLMTLTGTVADLQGASGDGITVEVVNVDQPISVLIDFGGV